MNRMLMAVTLLLLAGCAGVPDPPGCGGVYRSLNPTRYTLKESSRAPVQTTLDAT